MEHHESRVFGRNRAKDRAEREGYEREEATNEAMAGGKSIFITTVESPQVALYGNVAVASFMSMFSVYPHEQEPIQTEPTWVTLVLVKDGRSWGIAHTRVSTITAN